MRFLLKILFAPILAVLAVVTWFFVFVVSLSSGILCIPAAILGFFGLFILFVGSVSYGAGLLLSLIHILPNVEALRAAQPKDLDASEIEVRLGATWIDKKYIQQFMFELLEPPLYARRSLEVNYSEFTAEWNISGKNSIPYNDINARMTYGTCLLYTSRCV